MTADLPPIPTASAGEAGGVAPPSPLSRYTRDTTLGDFAQQGGHAHVGRGREAERGLRHSIGA